MITTFRSQSGTSYLYDSVTNQIVRYGGPAASESAAPAADLARLGIEPEAKTDVSAGPSDDEVRRALERGWKRLNLCVSEDCNNRCDYCFHSGRYPYERAHRARAMTCETARRALDLFLTHASVEQAKTVNLFGGEPLLSWPLIVDLVARVEARAPGTTVQICTNGQLLDDERIAFAVEHGLTLSISLDGPRDVHDAWRVTRGGRGTWARVTSVLERIRAVDPRYFSSHVLLSCTVAPPYDLPRIGAFFAAHPHLRDRLARVVFISPHDNDLPTDPADAAAHLDVVRRAYVDAARSGSTTGQIGAFLFEPTLRDIHNRVMDPGPAVGTLGACIPGVEQIYVSVDGRLYPCQNCGSCGFMPLGSLDEGFDAGAAAAYLASFGRACREMCASCWACRLCRHCYVSHKKGDRLDAERTATACRDTRDQIRSCLGIYASVLEVRPDAFDFLRLTPAPARPA